MNNYPPGSMAGASFNRPECPDCGAELYVATWLEGCPDCDPELLTCQNCGHEYQDGRDRDDHECPEAHGE